MTCFQFEKPDPNTSSSLQPHLKPRPHTKHRPSTAPDSTNQRPATKSTALSTRPGTARAGVPYYSDAIIASPSNIPRSDALTAYSESNNKSNIPRSDAAYSHPMVQRPNTADSNKASNIPRLSSTPRPYTSPYTLPSARLERPVYGFRKGRPGSCTSR